MRILDICVPQMGEGLREVLIHKLLKKPGESVRRDEIIYVMESDKALVEVESPCEGILKEWLVEEANVLPVGAAIARIESASATEADKSFAVSSAITTVSTVRPGSGRDGAGVFIPPRTRAYCKSLGILEHEIPHIPSASGTLMPADVDRYRSQKPDGSANVPISSASPPAFRDRPLPARQRVLNFRMMRSTQAIAGTVKRQVDWRELKHAVRALRRAHPGVRATEFETLAYAVARATSRLPEFRSMLLKDDTIREFDHLELGLAVQQPNGELATAVVADADCLDFASFVAVTHDRVRRAFTGEDQVSERVPLHIDYVARLHVTDGIPVLIAPAVAVVFLCTPTGPAEDRKANLGVTFDHRLINGGRAAEFLAAIVEQIRSFARIGGGVVNHSAGQ
jgi:pyruvate dehydrogenase E2 component (dihydrolipoamide acetyltransferase)